MGYLFLAISVFAGLIKAFCGKKISNYVESYNDAMLTNFVRMLLCIVIGFGIVIFSGDLSALSIDAKSFFIILLSGVSTSLFVIMWVICVKQGAYMMLEVFLMLGVILTTILCRIFFGEEIRVNQYIGFVILVFAAYLMCSYNTALKGTFTFKSLVLLLACTISLSLSDFSQKLYVETASDVRTSIFNFYTYIFSSLVLSASFLIFKSKDKGPISADVKLVKSIFGTVAVMAICLFANSFFKVLAAKELDAATLFPLSQGTALILSSLMAAVFFKEKPSAKSIAGMICAFAGLIIINLL